MNKHSRDLVTPGSTCWVWRPEQGQYVPANLISQLQGQIAEVLLANKERLKVPLEEVSQRSNRKSYSQQHDLVGMDVLNEAEIFMALRSRYLQDQLIYTLMGQTLVAVNPYQLLKIYGEQFVQKYRALTGSTSRGLPHVYEIARQAENSLSEDLRNQAVLITGESGAGKTETLKYLVEYLCYESDKSAVGINERIIACNPIMEAFGNAATSRNSNSSRFGKFIKLSYSYHHKQLKLMGAEIENYLLEKTRVVGCAVDESNFHIFQMLQRGANSQQRQRYRLNEVVKCNASKEDEQVLLQLMSLFKQSGFAETQIDAILRIIAAIMNLLVVSFKAQAGKTDDKCSIEGESLVRNFTDLLGANFQEVSDSLLQKTITVGKSSIRSPLKLEECQKIRNGLCKNLYEALFDFIVERLNNSLNPHRNSDTKQYTVGLLDIFGFESFARNSLEQLFINYTNERLQQIYIQYVFKSVQQDMLAEKVDAQCLQNFVYADNSAVLSVLDIPPAGLFDILQDSCALANDDDQAFLNKLKKVYPKDSQLTFDRKSKEQGLIINHTASPVVYNVLGFRSKNMDIRKLELTTTDKLIAAVLHSKTSQPVNSRFVSMALRKELQNLTENELKPCNLFFIRCIKPNQRRAAFEFEGKFVAEQIRYLGILQAVRVRKQGFSEKIAFGEFVQKYRFLTERSCSNEKQKIEEIERRLKTKYQKGSHKLFLKAEQSEQLRQLFLVEHQKKVQLVARIETAYLRYRRNKVIKGRLRAICGMGRLARSLWKIELGRKNHAIKHLRQCIAAERVAAKPEVLKESAKKNMDIQSVAPQYSSVGETKPLFKKQQAIAMRAILESTTPEVSRQKEMPEPDSPQSSQRSMTHGFPLHNGAITLQKEPEHLSPEMSPAYYNFVQPEFPVSTGTPNKEFHSPLVEQLLSTSQSFQSYCRENLFFKYSKDIDGQLEKLLSYRSKNLSHAMLRSAEEILKEQSDFAFRCLLKIMGERKSRYSALDNLNHLVSLMMGIYRNKETGLEQSIVESVRHKRKAYESSRSSFWSTTQYNSTALNIIEESLQHKLVHNRQYAVKQYEALNDSPIAVMRDEIYLQIAKLFGGNGDSVKLNHLRESLEVLTRYFPPSRTLIWPYLHFVSSQKFLKESTARNNLVVFAECYTTMNAFCENEGSVSLATTLQALELLDSRRSELGQFELDGKLSLTVQVYDKTTVTLTFGNETLGAIKKAVTYKLGLQQLANHYSLWHSMNTGLPGQFINEQSKVVDYINESIKQCQEQALVGRKDCSFSLSLRLKYFFPFRKTQPRLVGLVFAQISQEFKEGRFDLSLQEQAHLASIVLYLQRGSYDKTKFRPAWLSQFRGASEQLITLITNSYAGYAPADPSPIFLQLQFLTSILQTNPHIFQSQQFQVTFFEVERLQGSFKKSAVGMPMLMIIKPTYLLMVDPERRKSFDRIEFAAIDKWGLSKSKTPCLIIQTTNQELKIFASESIHIVEEILSEYIARLSGSSDLRHAENVKVSSQ